MAKQDIYEDDEIEQALRALYREAVGTQPTTPQAQPLPPAPKKVPGAPQSTEPYVPSMAQITPESLSGERKEIDSEVDANLRALFREAVGAPSVQAGLEAAAQPSYTPNPAGGDTLQWIPGLGWQWFTPGEQPAEQKPAGKDTLSQAMDLLRKHEGFRETPYWDVNAFRAGYGSDTITHKDGRVEKVGKGSRVTREQAELDLNRRAQDFLYGARKKIGPAVWDSLPQNAQAALVSVAYNYGSIPNRILDRVRKGTAADVAIAIRSLAKDKPISKKGVPVNFKRRNEEADYAAAVETTSGRGPTPEAFNTFMADRNKRMKKAEDIDGLLSEYRRRVDEHEKLLAKSTTPVDRQHNRGAIAKLEAEINRLTEKQTKVWAGYSEPAWFGDIIREGTIQDKEAALKTVDVAPEDAYKEFKVLRQEQAGHKKRYAEAIATGNLSEIPKLSARMLKIDARLQKDPLRGLGDPLPALTPGTVAVWDKRVQDVTKLIHKEEGIIRKIEAAGGSDSERRAGVVALRKLKRNITSKMGDLRYLIGDPDFGYQLKLLEADNKEKALDLAYNQQRFAQMNPVEKFLVNMTGTATKALGTLTAWGLSEFGRSKSMTANFDEYLRSQGKLGEFETSSGTGRAKGFEGEGVINKYQDWVERDIKGYWDKVTASYINQKPEWYEQVGQVLGSSIPFAVMGSLMGGVVPGGITASSGARMVAAATSGIGEAWTNAGFNYFDGIEAGMPREEARARAYKGFAVEAVTNTLLSRFGEFSDVGAKNALGKFLKWGTASAFEGVEEGIQKGIGNWALGKPLLEGVPEEMLWGAIAGGIMIGPGILFSHYDKIDNDKTLTPEQKVNAKAAARDRMLGGLLSIIEMNTPQGMTPVEVRLGKPGMATLLRKRGTDGDTRVNGWGDPIDSNGDPVGLSFNFAGQEVHFGPGVLKASGEAVDVVSIAAPTEDGKPQVNVRTRRSRQARPVPVEDVVTASPAEAAKVEFTQPSKTRRRSARKTIGGPVATAAPRTPTPAPEAAEGSILAPSEYQSKRVVKYAEAKAANPDATVMFAIPLKGGSEAHLILGSDAVAASEALGIPTSPLNDKSGKVLPAIAIQDNALEQSIKKLNAAGITVASVADIGGELDVNLIVPQALKPTRGKKDAPVPTPKQRDRIFTELSKIEKKIEDARAGVYLRPDGAGAGAAKSTAHLFVDQADRVRANTEKKYEAAIERARYRVAAAASQGFSPAELLDTIERMDEASDGRLITPEIQAWLEKGDRESAKALFEKHKGFSNKKPTSKEAKTTGEAGKVPGQGGKRPPYFVNGQRNWKHGKSPPQFQRNKMTVDEVEQAAWAIGDKLGVTTHVFPNYDALPLHYRKELEKWNGPDIGKSVNGVYDAQGKFVIILADRMQGEWHVEITMLHEIVGHHYVREAYTDFENVIEDWANNLGMEISDILQMASDNNIDIQHYYDSYAAIGISDDSIRVALFDELIAHLAETSGDLKSRIQEYIGMVRKFLRDIGLIWMSQASIYDLRYLMKKIRKDYFLARDTGVKTPGENAPMLIPSRYENQIDDFYSAMVMSAAAAKGAPKKATAEGWIKWLDSAQARGDFKEEERIWSEVDRIITERGNMIQGDDKNIGREEFIELVENSTIVMEEIILDNDSYDAYDENEERYQYAHDDWEEQQPPTEPDYESYVMAMPRIEEDFMTFMTYSQFVDGPGRSVMKTHPGQDYHKGLDLFNTAGFELIGGASYRDMSGFNLIDYDSAESWDRNQRIVGQNDDIYGFSLRVSWEFQHITVDVHDKGSDSYYDLPDHLAPPQDLEKFYNDRLAELVSDPDNVTENYNGRRVVYLGYPAATEEEKARRLAIIDFIKNDEGFGEWINEIVGDAASELEEERLSEIYERWAEQEPQREDFDEDDDENKDARYESHTAGFIEKSGYEEYLFVYPGHKMRGEDRFTGGHWNDPNVIVHARTTRRYTPDGEVYMYIEEVQSDWHQAGRTRGYVNVEAREKRSEIERGIQDEFAADVHSARATEQEAWNAVRNANVDLTDTTHNLMVDIYTYLSNLSSDEIQKLSERTINVKGIQVPTTEVLFWNDSLDLRSAVGLRDGLSNAVYRARLISANTPATHSQELEDLYGSGTDERGYHVLSTDPLIGELAEAANPGLFATFKEQNIVREQLAAVHREANKKWRAILTQMDEARAARMEGIPEAGSIPNAPFRKSEQWGLLAIKRLMIKEASDGHIKGIALAPGIIPSLEWGAAITGNTGIKIQKDESGVLAIFMTQGGYESSLLGNVTEGKELADVKKVLQRTVQFDVPGMSEALDQVAQELVEKGEASFESIAALQAPHNKTVSYANPKYAEFYDVILPNAIDKLLKPFGAQVERKSTKLGALPAHVIDFTPEMREKFKQGLPLFARSLSAVSGVTDELQVDEATVAAKSASPNMSRALSRMAPSVVPAKMSDPEAGATLTGEALAESVMKGKKKDVEFLAKHLMNLVNASRQSTRAQIKAGAEHFRSMVANDAEAMSAFKSVVIHMAEAGLIDAADPSIRKIMVADLAKIFRNDFTKERTKKAPRKKRTKRDIKDEGKGAHKITSDKTSAKGAYTEPRLIELGNREALNELLGERMDKAQVMDAAKSVDPGRVLNRIENGAYAIEVHEVVALRNKMGELQDTYNEAVSKAKAAYDAQDVGHIVHLTEVREQTADLLTRYLKALHRIGTRASFTLNFFREVARSKYSIEGLREQYVKLNGSMPDAATDAMMVALVEQRANLIEARDSLMGVYDKKALDYAGPMIARSIKAKVGARLGQAKKGVSGALAPIYKQISEALRKNGGLYAGFDPTPIMEGIVNYLSLKRADDYANLSFEEMVDAYVADLKDVSRETVIEAIVTAHANIPISDEAFWNVSETLTRAAQSNEEFDKADALKKLRDEYRGYVQKLKGKLQRQEKRIRKAVERAKAGPTNSEEFAAALIAQQAGLNDLSKVADALIEELITLRRDQAGIKAVNDYAEVKEAMQKGTIGGKRKNKKSKRMAEVAEQAKDDVYAKKLEERVHELEGIMADLKAGKVPEGLLKAATDPWAHSPRILALRDQIAALNFEIKAELEAMSSTDPDAAIMPPARPKKTDGPLLRGVKIAKARKELEAMLQAVASGEPYQVASDDIGGIAEEIDEEWDRLQRAIRTTERRLNQQVDKETMSPGAKVIAWVKSWHLLSIMNRAVDASSHAFMALEGIPGVMVGETARIMGRALGKGVYTSPNIAKYRRIMGRQPALRWYRQWLSIIKGEGGHISAQIEEDSSDLRYTESGQTSTMIMRAASGSDVPALDLISRSAFLDIAEKYATEMTGYVKDSSKEGLVARLEFTRTMNQIFKQLISGQPGPMNVEEVAMIQAEVENYAKWVTMNSRNWVGDVITKLTKSWNEMGLKGGAWLVPHFALLPVVWSARFSRILANVARVSGEYATYIPIGDMVIPGVVPFAEAIGAVYLYSHESGIPAWNVAARFSTLNDMQKRVVIRLLSRGLNAVALFFIGGELYDEGWLDPNVIKTSRGRVFIENGFFMNIGGPTAAVMAGAVSRKVDRMRERNILTDAQAQQLLWQSSLFAFLNHPLASTARNISVIEGGGLEEIILKETTNFVLGGGPPKDANKLIPDEDERTYTYGREEIRDYWLYQIPWARQNFLEPRKDALHPDIGRPLNVR